MLRAIHRLNNWVILFWCVTVFFANLHFGMVLEIGATRKANCRVLSTERMESSVVNSTNN